ncbi:MAG: GGDEF domain-containing protein [Lachnospiraceae bacterium]|nr:GGDEF domain-containing protein [Lachnospiraceae bacterium]
MNQSLDKRDEKIIQAVLFFIVLSFVVGIFAQLAIHVKAFVYNPEGTEGYVEYSDSDYNWRLVDDLNAPQKKYSEITFTIDPNLEKDTDLIFYTLHSGVTVYIDGHLTYIYNRSRDIQSIKTPGNKWHNLQIDSSMAGKKVKICIIPTYKFHVNDKPILYMGNPVDVYAHVIWLQGGQFMCAVVSLVVGIAFVIFNFVTRRLNEAIGNGLTKLGIFAILVAVWKIADLKLLYITTTHPVALSYVALVSVILLPNQFMYYEQDLFRTEKKKYLNILMLIDVGALVYTFVMQFMGIADIRETLYIHHIIIEAVIIVSIYLGVVEAREFGLSKNLKVAGICVFICEVGVASDMLLFYIKVGTLATSFGMIGFLIYILVLGARNARDIQDYIELGKNADKYRRMAQFDELTGVGNRLGLTNKLNDYGFKPTDYAFFMFDLNDLKGTNDHFGHDMGDRYIVTAVDILKKVFTDTSMIYRMGGDEFMVLLRGATDEVCIECLKRIDELAEQHNESEDIKYNIAIAGGYAFFDADKDADVHDTMKRADRNMYINKYRMKGKYI